MRRLGWEEFVGERQVACFASESIVLAQTVLIAVLPGYSLGTVPRQTR